MKPAGPFTPTHASTGQADPQTHRGSRRYSMAGDDCSLHFDLSQLTPKQQADHTSNQILTAMLQVALLYIAQNGDEVCLYSTFQEAPWAEALDTYHRLFTTMDLEPLALSSVTYHPMQGFYPSVAETATSCELETLYMISHSNYPLHQDQQLLTVSQNLNSKVHFAQHAPIFGLPVPDTMHCQKQDLSSPQVEAFFTQHSKPLMLKTLGLAGARNVTTVANIDQAQQYLADYPPQMDVILQQRLDLAHYTEMTVDLFVSDTELTITNVRKILFADGLWVGNLMGGTVSLPTHHQNILLQVGEYARQHGFVSPYGYNLGIDYFVRNDDAPGHLEEVVITEINARWTGGLFPAELIRRLGVEAENVVAFIDLCPPRHLNSYLKFIEQHLHTQSSSAFSIAPMGFAPFPVEMEGEEQLFVWQIVIGDFEAFKESKQLALGEEVLITAPLISTGLGA